MLTTEYFKVFGSNLDEGVEFMIYQQVDWGILAKNTKNVNVQIQITNMYQSERSKENIIIFQGSQCVVLLER